MPPSSRPGKNQVWKLQSRERPLCCPNCHQEDSLNYVGFALNYEPGWRAKMYECKWCGAWLDCVWPQNTSRASEDTPQSILKKLL